MVFFTVRNPRNGSSMRVDVDSGESVDEVIRMAAEWSGRDEIMLRKGYRIVAGPGRVGDAVSQGDVLDIIPDLSALPKV